MKKKDGWEWAWGSVYEVKMARVSHRNTENLKKPSIKNFQKEKKVGEKMDIGSTPMEAVQYLINHKTLIDVGSPIFGQKWKVEEIETFTVSDLEQIAKHLLIYCEYRKQEEGWD